MRQIALHRRWRSVIKRLTRRLHLLQSFAVLLLLGVCALIRRPREHSITTRQRLQHLPREAFGLSRPVSIFWDSHQIPFIEADTDDDLALALGIVHAHLRLSQMEIMRRIARGRVAEALGPVAVELDQALRILDLGRAAPQVLAGMPGETRRFLDGFVAGLNLYVDRCRALPRDFRLLGFRREAWTAEDVIALGRLVSADVNWILWFPLLAERRKAGWPELWRRLLAYETGIPASAEELGSAGAALGGVIRSGSNAFAVSGRRTGSGRPLIANDPHLGLFLPNPWLIAGIGSPSYRAVGLMVPGLPFVAIGRNAALAWGGTNLHAASSELVDVSGLPPETFTVRRERIGVRFGSAREVTMRESPFGPVISDCRWSGCGPGEAIALRWIGHRPSDEITALLTANRAQSAEEFRQAFAGFAVPGQNIVYADAKGHIGRLTAVRLPRREQDAPPDLVCAPGGMDAWSAFVASPELPACSDPPEDFIASANDRPPGSPVPLGWFFSPWHRLRRLRALLDRARALDTESVRAILLDTYLEPAAAFRDRLLAWAQALDGVCSAPAVKLLRAIERWDGAYAAESEGAAAFELLVGHLARALFGPEELARFELGWGGRARLYGAIEEANDESRTAALAAALPRAASAFAQEARWGGLHRLVLRHPLGLVPVIGRLYTFADLPASGSSETLHKTAHRLVRGRHPATYGSTARHISDLADPDRNFFVILGGQDGYLGSVNFSDQVPLWRAGTMIEVPLRAETVRASFPFHTRIDPAPEAKVR